MASSLLISAITFARLGGSGRKLGLIFAFQQQTDINPQVLLVFTAHSDLLVHIA